MRQLPRTDQANESVISMRKRNPKHKNKQSTSGFTFMEVMVALVFIAISLVMFLNTANFHQEGLAESRWKENALLNANNKMQELLLEGVSSSTVRSGDFRPAAPQLHWKADSELTDAEHVYRFQVTVFEKEKKEKRELVVESLFTE